EVAVLSKVQNRAERLHVILKIAGHPLKPTGFRAAPQMWENRAGHSAHRGNLDGSSRGGVAPSNATTAPEPRPGGYRCLSKHTGALAGYGRVLVQSGGAAAAGAPSHRRPGFLSKGPRRGGLASRGSP